MKKVVILIILLMIILSCSEDKLVEGKLYITLVNFYDPQVIGSQEKIESLKNQLINKDVSLDKPLMKYYKILIDNNLFDKPTFQLKLKNNNIINVYLSKKEFFKLKEQLKYFDREKEIISVKFKGNKISEGIYNRSIYSALKLISIEKTKGKTDWNK